MHILAIDIGNTAISVGLIKDEKIYKEYNFIENSLTDRQLRRQLSIFLDNIAAHKSHPQICIICSVVPHYTPIVKQIVKEHLEIKIQVIGRDIEVPIKNKYRDPKQVGQDRLIGAYAAKMIYGSPVIIIDFGTAITFDLVNSKGEYEGGIIVPGLRLSAETLFHKTALLPRIEHIKVPRELIGKDTQQSILSGLFNGYAQMCRGLIDQIQASLSKKSKVILTGGYTEMMLPFLKDKVSKVENKLIFKGINFIADCF